VAQAKEGDRVQVHYTGRLDDESQFDSSVGSEPLEFTIGEGELIPGFEEAVTGLSPGDSVDTRIEAAAAYGERREELMVKVDRAEIPADLDLQIGEQLQVQTSDGQELVLNVAELDQSYVTLDGNHPLAGEALNFEIELLEIL
jgi:FKBP-type peptidyl-prolyl cis-trans isomerase 2